MSATAPQATITISLTELEALIRRTVREAVHEELIHLFRNVRPTVVDDWDHEGSDDPEGDQSLIKEALALHQQYRMGKEGWKDWEDFKAELDMAEAAGELPN